MRVSISSQHVDLDEIIRGYIGQRVRDSLARVEDRVTSVKVHLTDVNGTKGGIDKHCEVIANCGKLGVLRTDTLSKGLRTAVDSATEKLRRAAEHAVDHKRGERKAKVPHRRARK